MDVKLILSCICCSVGLLLSFVAVCTPYWVTSTYKHFGLFITPGLTRYMILGLVNLFMGTAGLIALVWGICKKNKLSLKIAAALVILSALDLFVIACMFGVAIIAASGTEAGYSLILSIAAVPIYVIGGILAVIAEKQITAY